MMAATLILEAIVVLLAIPVVGAVGGGLSPGSLGYLIGLAALLILLTGLQRRSWAIWVNLGAQAVLLAGFVIYPGKLTVADSFRIGCIGRIGEKEMRGALAAVREVLDEMGVSDPAARAA